MARVAGGDQTAFALLVRRHGAQCVKAAQRFSRDPADAEDVVQEAHLRIWQNAAGWRGSNSQLTSWLYRIVANVALNHGRRRRHSLVSIDDVETPPDPAPSAQMLAEVRQLEALMAKAIAELPARQSTALSLCLFDAMDCAEAAEAMRVSVSAMESLLIRARRTLRKQWDALGGDPARRGPDPDGR